MVHKADQVEPKGDIKEDGVARLSYSVHGDMGLPENIGEEGDAKWLHWLRVHRLASLQGASNGGASWRPETWIPGAVEDGSLPKTDFIPDEGLDLASKLNGLNGLGPSGDPGPALSDG